MLQGWLSTHLLTATPGDAETAPNSWQLLRTLTAYIITQDTHNAEVRTSHGISWGAIFSLKIFHI